MLDCAGSKTRFNAVWISVTERSLEDVVDNVLHSRTSTGACLFVAVGKNVEYLEMTGYLPSRADEGLNENGSKEIKRARNSFLDELLNRGGKRKKDRLLKSWTVPAQVLWLVVFVIFVGVCGFSSTLLRSIFT